MVRLFPFLVLFLTVLLWSCQDEPRLSIPEKMQGRWEVENTYHYFVEFDGAIFRSETAVPKGTDKCGSTRWHTSKEIFSYKMIRGGFKTSEIGTAYETIYECDSTDIQFWQPYDCPGNRSYLI